MYCNLLMKRLGLLVFLQAMHFVTIAAPIQDPCAGPKAITAMVDRPTVADSACVVPNRQGMLEVGGEYQVLLQGAGHQTNYPEGEFRFGLPANNEFVIVSPNIIHQSTISQSGLNASTVGLKHEIGYTAQWLGAMEVLFTLPSGSRAFGSQGTGVAANGIVTYAVSSRLGLSMMLGITTNTLPALYGGGQYTSLNPDWVATFALNDAFGVYGEIYGQTKTSPQDGSGYNMDSGFVWQASSNVVFDIEFGQRLSGHLNGFEHYVGMGIAFLS